jgi:hypothetical protein
MLLWPIWSYYPIVHLDGLRETKKTLIGIVTRIETPNQSLQDTSLKLYGLSQPA